MCSKSYKAAGGLAVNRTQVGMTLIEMMLAMAISSVLLLGSFTIYTQTRSSYRTTESVAHLQENVRFAMNTLEHDVQLAQFWGLTNRTDFDQEPGVSIVCDGIDVTAWALRGGGDTSVGVDASDDVYDLPCPGSDPRDDSDVLIIRHASPEPAIAPVDDRVQIQTSTSWGEIFESDIPPQPVSADRPIHDVIVNAYYISNQSRFDPSLPALRRRSLVGNVMQDQEIIPGVENMQIQFGIDDGDNGQVNGYVDSGHFKLDETNTKIRSLRLWLLVRSEMSEQGQGYVDTKTYATPDADLADITPVTDPDYPAEFRRASITKTIFLRNM